MHQRGTTFIYVSNPGPRGIHKVTKECNVILYRQSYRCLQTRLSSSSSPLHLFVALPPLRLSVRLSLFLSLSLSPSFHIHIFIFIQESTSMITFVLRSWTLLLLCMMTVTAIQNGSTITDASWYPFYVMLGNPHVCGGILLTYNPATILTAAHCVADATPPAGKTSPFFVGYKAAERAKHAYNPIEDWLTHPSYVINEQGDVDMHFDMAIVKLAHPIEPSKHLHRVALWPANKTLPQYTRGKRPTYPP